MIAEQSVDGINIARRSEACTERLHSQPHNTTSPPTPPAQCWPGQYLFHSGGVSSKSDFNIALGGPGEYTLQKSCWPIQHHTSKFRAIFIPSTVQTGLVVGGRIAEYIAIYGPRDGPRDGPRSTAPWTVGRPVDRPLDHTLQCILLFVHQQPVRSVLLME